MKRINDRERHIRNQRRRALRSLIQRSRIKFRSRGHNANPQPLNIQSASEIRLDAPKIFSLMGNPNETLRFFAKFDSANRTHDKIYINLEDVAGLTIDALLLLISKIKGRSGSRCKMVGGNEPKDKAVKLFLQQCGFYKHLTGRPKGYDDSKDQGLFSKHEGKRVRQDVSAAIVHFATERVYGKQTKNGGIYRTLIECMANTKDHATVGAAKPQSWWVSVHYDSERRVAFFAFLDCGVGIFQSVKMKGTLRNMGKFLGLVTWVDVLMDVLEAKLTSRTGLPYRGKGLPSIKRALDRGQIINLQILSNLAYLDVTTGKGKILDIGFRGTCLTWELHRDRKENTN